MADHAASGIVQEFPSEPIETGKRWYDALTSHYDQMAFDTAMEIVGMLSDDELPIESGAAVKNAWREYTALSDRYNEPGRISALIGYVYTTNGGDVIAIPHNGNLSNGRMFDVESFAGGAP